MKKAILAVSLISVSSYAVGSTSLTNGFELGYAANSKAYDVKLEGNGEYINNSGEYATAYLTGEDEIDLLSSALTVGYTWFVDDKMVNLHGSYGFSSEWEVGNAEGDFDDAYSIGIDYGLKVLTPNTFVGLTAEYSSSSYDSNETGTFYGFPANASVSAE